MNKSLNECFFAMVYKATNHYKHCLCKVECYIKEIFLYTANFLLIIVGTTR